MHEIVIRNGTVVDGTGASRRVADVAVQGGRIVAELPTGGRRLMQAARGYRHTFVSGVEIRRDDAFTGELPGRLLR